jgi:hypothetical protein
MKNPYYLIVPLSLVLMFFFIPSANAAIFNPNLIITNEEMLDSKSMTLSDIELFLKSKDGYISRNYFPNSDGELKSAAQIIYDAANNYDCHDIVLSSKPTRAEREQKCRYAPINPKFLLVLLQKEQSLVEAKSPTQKQLDWATGYGVCDDCSMDDPAIQRWKGFGKQLNSASLQFSDYLRNPSKYGYKAGNTYVISNTGRPPSIVTIQNDATAGLYNYTPHVYHGNFNFFNIWLRYFLKSYPNNSLLQAKGETGVWLIKDGSRRPFMSRGALTSRFDINKIIQVNASDLEKYPIGTPIKFSQYSLVRSPRGTIFLIVDDFRRGFTSQEAFRKLGFNPEEVVDASWDDLNFYQEGKPITTDSDYPTGALLQDKSSGGIYYVSEGTKAPLWDRILLKTRFKNLSIFPVDSQKLAGYKTIEPARFQDGEILKADNSPAVYVIDDSKKRAVVSADVFTELGYKWANIIIVPSKLINLYEDGAPLASLNNNNIEIIDMTVEAPIDQSASGTNQNLPLTESPSEEEINDIINP